MSTLGWWGQNTRPLVLVLALERTCLYHVYRQTCHTLKVDLDCSGSAAWPLYKGLLSWISHFLAAQAHGVQGSGLNQTL